MSNPLQWTADQLLDQLAKVKARFKSEWDEMGKSNRAVAALSQRADAITDPARRRAAQRSITLWSQRQVRLQNDFIKAYGKYRAAYDRIAAFLRGIGINAPADTGLGALGVIPVVPAVIAGLVVAALAWVAWMHDQNVTQRQGLHLQAQALDALISGEISPADFDAATKRANDSAQPKKPPGLDDLTGMLVPALGLVALIVLGPSIMRMIPTRQRAA